MTLQTVAQLQILNTDDTSKSPKCKITQDTTHNFEFLLSVFRQKSYVLLRNRTVDYSDFIWAS